MLIYHFWLLVCLLTLAPRPIPIIVRMLRHLPEGLAQHNLPVTQSKNEMKWSSP